MDVGREKRTSTVDLVVATDAKVELENIFGTLTAIASKKSLHSMSLALQINTFIESDVPIACVAKHGRPAGAFYWRVGSENDPNAKVFQNPKPPLTIPDGAGYLNVREEFTFRPEIGDSEKGLFCVYQQMDQNGKVLYEDSDHVLLSVYFLSDPPQERDVKRVAVSKIISIKLDFFQSLILDWL